MSSMRDTASGRPSSSLQHLQRAQVLAESIRPRAVELQPIAIRPHSPMPYQVARVLMAEQVFSRSHWAGVELSQRGLQRIVERVSRLLVPEEWILAQHLGVRNRGLKIEAPIRIHRKLRL